MTTFPVLQPTTSKQTTVLAIRHGGTHLINPIVRYLTGKAVYTPKSQFALEAVPTERLVICTRDPRNSLISQFRYKRKRGNYVPAECDIELAAYINALKDGMGPVEYRLLWAKRWCNWAWGFRTSFETIVGKGVEEVTRIRDYLEAPGDPQEVWEKSYGKSYTFTGSHSQWKDWFGPHTNAAWAKHGGVELLAIMGYEDA